MERLLLVRHAEPTRPADRGGPALTPRGLRQAQTLAERLATDGVAAVYSSPAARTWQTATTISEFLKTPLVALGLLGDSPGGSAQRGEEIIRWLSSEHPGRETVMAVTHLPSIRLIVSQVLGLEVSRHDQLRLDVASITEVQLTAGRLVLASMNDTAHLRPLDD